VVFVVDELALYIPKIYSYLLITYKKGCKVRYRHGKDDKTGSLGAFLQRIIFERLKLAKAG